LIPPITSLPKFRTLLRRDIEMRLRPPLQAFSLLVIDKENNARVVARAAKLARDASQDRRFEQEGTAS
jgi:hypothetical protein